MQLAAQKPYNRMAEKKGRQHFVARAYLRGFSRNDMLWGWFRESNEIRDVHINSVAVEHGFYDLILADGTPCDELEDALAVFDGMTPEIIRNATSRTNIDASTAEGIRRLYATTLARNHQGRDLLVPSATRIRLRAEEMYDADFPNGAFDQRRWAVDYVLREVFEVPAHLSPDSDTISRLNILRLAEDILGVMPLHVYVLRSKAQNVLTSDAPCSYFDLAQPPRGDGEYSGPNDWASPSLELTIPLDKRHVALIVNRELDAVPKLNINGMRVVNARTAFFTKRVIMACPTDDLIEAAFFETQVLTERTAFDVPLLPQL